MKNIVLPARFRKITFWTAWIAMLITYSSCTKDSTQKDCEVYKRGTITISNSSSNPYDIYIDGVQVIRLSGNTISKPIDIDEGNNRELYAKQVSGYILFPTERSAKFNVLRCSDYSWQIP